MLRKLRDRAFVLDLIEREHFGLGKSVRQIERDIGVGKTALNHWCKRHGIAVRGQSDAASLHMSTREAPSGEDHWRAQRPEASARLSAQHRRRMSGPKNPVYDREAKRKAARSRAVTFRANPSEHEAMMADMLATATPEPVFQRAVGPYVVDFAFMDAKVALELDGRGHASRSTDDAKRDRWLIGRGWTVVRVDQDNLWNPRADTPVFAPGKLVRVLKNLIPNLKVSGAPPSLGRKYRVLVRDKEHPAGRRL